jgi:predicted Rossmann fold nucleotide-binding protein DprA/Smf involved in DNA uptake
LRAGALPVTCAGDLLEALGLDPDSGRVREPDLEGLDLARGEALTIEQVAQRLGGTMAEAQAKIVELEIEGIIDRGVDGLIRRRN